MARNRTSKLSTQTSRTARPKGTHGGRRRGAGAPEGNLNGLTHGLRSKQYLQFLLRFVNDPVARTLLLPSSDGKRRVTQRSCIEAAGAILRHRGTPDFPALQAALPPLSQRSVRRLARKLVTHAINKGGIGQMRNWAFASCFSTINQDDDLSEQAVSPDASGRYNPIMAVELKRYIRSVPDFPRPGVMFRDITPLVHNPLAYACAADALVEHIEPLEPDAIVAIESRGFLFGAPVALRLGVPFVPVRKAGHLPAEHMSVEYALEYGEGQLDIHSDALTRGQRVVVVDDLLATGGTAAATAKLVEGLGASVAAFAFVIELIFLPGRAALGDYDVFTLIQYEDES